MIENPTTSLFTVNKLETGLYAAMEKTASHTEAKGNAPVTAIDMALNGSGEAPVVPRESTAIPLQVQSPADSVSATKDDKIKPQMNDSFDERSQYVTGAKLAVVVGSMCLACFLMLIDTMVISTVSHTGYSPLCLWVLVDPLQLFPLILSDSIILPDKTCYIRPSPESRMSFTLLETSVGTPVHTNLEGMLNRMRMNGAADFPPLPRQSKVLCWLGNTDLSAVNVARHLNH